MKTTTVIVTAIFLSLQIEVECQNQNKLSGASTVKVISVPHADYVMQLLNEVSAMSEKAELFRTQARDEEGEKQKKLLKDATYLEKLCLEKQIEVFEINYALNSRLFTENKSAIASLQSKTNSKQNGMHLQYLINEAGKNMKQANELAEESSSQSNLALRMGTLDNAEEKILLALKEQTEAIEILRSNSKMVANK